MSTYRYCGELRIRVTLLDPDWTPPVYRTTYEYRCAISAPGTDRCTIYVKAPAHLTAAVDSPEAFDNTARTALAFAADEGHDIGDHADFSDTGYAIRRSR